MAFMKSIGKGERMILDGFNRLIRALSGLAFERAVLEVLRTGLICDLMNLASVCESENGPF